MQTSMKANPLPSEATAPVAQPELIAQRFDQAMQRASAALRELEAAAAGAVLGVELKDSVDYLGHLKAQAATIEDIEKRFKEKLIQSGQDKIDGELFKATVSVSDRATLNMEKVRAKLSPQFIAANTNVTQVVMVRIVARTRL